MIDATPKLPTAAMCQDAWDVVVPSIHNLAREALADNVINGTIVVVDGTKAEYFPIFQGVVRQKPNYTGLLVATGKANHSLRRGNDAKRGGAIYNSIIVAYGGNGLPYRYQCAIEDMMATLVYAMMYRSTA